MGFPPLEEEEVSLQETVLLDDGLQDPVYVLGSWMSERVLVSYASFFCLIALIVPTALYNYWYSDDRRACVVILGIGVVILASLNITLIVRDDGASRLFIMLYSGSGVFLLMCGFLGVYLLDKIQEIKQVLARLTIEEADEHVSSTD
ncbi:hypothetical protein H6770_04470 [Candidatus Peribacteria bacterium]|nr:hypothetical protein [Candidatus Peribacteria bacterium]